MNIFKDNNQYNEKSIIGAVAFVLVVLGCFGIAGLEKFAKK